MEVCWGLRAGASLEDSPAYELKLVHALIEGDKEIFLNDTLLKTIPPVSRGALAALARITKQVVHITKQPYTPHWHPHRAPSRRLQTRTSMTTSSTSSCRQTERCPGTRCA